jgi:outer membrane protein assembly factor BamB
MAAEPVAPAFALQARDLLPRIFWSRSLPDSPAGGPAAGGGLVYVTLVDGSLRAYRLADGAEAWTRELGTDAQTGPAYVKGLVVVADTSRRLRAFDAATGEPKWEASLMAQATSEIGVSETVLCLGEGNRTCAAYGTADGKPLWRVTTRGDVVGAPFIGDSSVVFGDTGHALYAVAKLSGEVSRQIVLSGEVYGRVGGEPGGASRSLVAVGTHDGRVHGITAVWDRHWAARVRGIVRSAPLVRAEVVFAGSDEGVVYEIDKGDGTVRWATGVGGPVVERMSLQPWGLMVPAGGAISVLDPKSGKLVEDLPVGGTIVGMAEEAGTLVVSTSTARLAAAGVRVPEKAERPKKPAGLVSVIVDPTIVVPKKGLGTVVTFSLTEPRSLVVDVADARGRRVRLLANRDRAWPDTYRYEWDGMTEGKKPAVPGVYRLRVVAGEEEVSVGIEVAGPR